MFNDSENFVTIKFLDVPTTTSLQGVLYEKTMFEPQSAIMPPGDRRQTAHSSMFNGGFGGKRDASSDSKRVGKTVQYTHLLSFCRMC